MKTKKVTVTFLMAVGLMTMLFLVCPRMEVNAKTTITVNSVDQKTAKAVHSQLTKGKEFDIRFPGDENAFYQKFQKLSKKVAKCTDYGFDIYPICYAGIKSGDSLTEVNGYTIYTIKQEYCHEYIYGIKYAQQQVKDFKKQIDKIISKSKKICNALEKGTIEPQYGKKSKKKLLSDTKKTITNLKDLKSYLSKTKFRNLSEAMKARILLEFGYMYGRSWGKASMKLVEDKKQGHDYTFRSLYRRKAYGRNVYHATLACKICAVFNIGDFDFLYKKIGGTPHNVVRVKVKTSKNKTRYAIVDGGVLAENYNSYAGYTIFDLMVEYRKAYKDQTPIKKIKKTQQLKEFDLGGRSYEAYDAMTGDPIVTYYINLPKSEW